MTNHILEFMGNNRSSLVKFVKRALTDKNDAEDVVQEAMLSVHQYANADIGVELAPSYTYTVLRRLCQTYNTSTQSRMSGEELKDSDSIELTFEQLHEDRLKDTLDPLEAILLEEKKDVIPSLIDKVGNEVHREFLDMVLLQDVTLSTAAELCGLTPGNGRIIFFRFLKGA